MKVLLVTKSFHRGGSASGAYNLAKALQSSGCEVIFLDAFEHQKKTLNGVVRVIERVFERTLYNSETHCFRLGKAVFDLAKCFEKHKPDVIQLCDISGNVVSFRDFASVPCPVVHRMSDYWPYHGPLHYSLTKNSGSFIASKFLEKTIYNGAYLPDALVAPSVWLAENLDSQLVGDVPVRVIRNAVETSGFHKSLKVCPEELHFGFVSNSIFDPRKGFLLIPPFLEFLARSGVKVYLHLYGRVAEKECPKIPLVRVIRHGPFTRSEHSIVYNSFDVLICPSQLDNSPNVICEAMSYGCPVIAQSGTGMDSYVSDATGLLIDFTSNSEKSLSDFLVFCKKVMCEYSDYSHAALSYTKNKLSPEAIGGAYLDLYEELMVSCRDKRRLLSE